MFWRPSHHWSNSLSDKGTLSSHVSFCRRRWFELKKVNQGENWSSPAAWCHWCWRDWVYRSKWAFVSRWCWPAIGSCRPKCCIPIACQILTFRRCLLPLGLYIKHNIDYKIPAGEDSGHRGQAPYEGGLASPSGPRLPPTRPSCAPSSTSSSCSRTRS